MNEHVFRKYDIRGKVGIDFIEDHVYSLTRAIACYFKKYHPQTKTLVVGRDGRIHSPAIAQEVIRALTDSGFTVLELGLCPTPVFYFALHTLVVDGGIMVTASHNGPEYNGMKINLRTDSVWGEDLQEIWRLYQRELYQQHAELAHRTPGIRVQYPLNEVYVQWLVDHFPQLHGCAYRMVFDCGNGAAGSVMPQLVHAMGWKHASLLYEEVDGLFPHHEADPTVAANMQDLQAHVIAMQADIGIGFDGDADRMIPLTHQGVLLPGDQLLALYAQDVLSRNPGGTVVFDGKCSLMVGQIIAQQGGVPQQAPSGHAIIKDYMRKYQALCAGELSGHFFFADSYFGFDDGIYAALRLMSILHTRKQSLEELRALLPVMYSTPEIRLDCADDKKFNVVAAIQAQVMRNDLIEVQLMDGIRMITSQGWALVRASHTQGAVSVRIESPTAEGLAQMKDIVLPLLCAHFDQKLLQIHF